MALNIKSERVHALAREAAAITGKSQTSVIELALERLLADLERRRRREQATEWFGRMKARRTDEERRVVRETMADMFDDETGLPR